MRFPYPTREVGSLLSLSPKATTHVPFATAYPVPTPIVTLAEEMKKPLHWPNWLSLVLHLQNVVFPATILMIFTEYH